MHSTRAVLIPLVAAFGLCVAAPAADAHHSWGTFYDMCGRVTVEGTVDSIEWKEPHTWLVVKADDGTIHRAELTSPRGLERQGFKADTLKRGDRVTVTGSPMRDPAVIRARVPDLKASPLWDADSQWKRISALREVRRAGDGWSWSQPGFQSCGPQP